ncbi:MAG: M55 family metallopeptidase [Noviherbaspirillum sp.]
MTKLLISVDIEGIAGIYHPEQTRPGNAEYDRGRKLMTEEANAVIEGALQGGATEVWVNDSHGHFRNLLPDLLHPKARLIQGKPRVLGMMSGVENKVDAVMMVGYHARAQSTGILAHTINSFAFAGIRINNQELGESGLYGALAGEHGIPVALISGDDVSNAASRLHFPDTVFVTVKEATGNTSGISMSPSEARTMLADGARSAMARIPDLVPFRLQAPLSCEVRTQGPAFADLFSQLPLVERLDGVHVRFDAPSVQYAIRVLNSLSAMSFMLR